MSDYDAAFRDAIGGPKKPTPSPYDDVLVKSLASALQPAMDYSKEKPTDLSFQGNLRFATPFGTVDTKIPLPEIVNKRMAQFGSGLSDLGYAFSNPKVVDEKRAIDAPLLDSGVGKGLRMMGKSAPAMALPNIGGPVLGGMGVGAFMGATEPVGSGESRFSNTVTSSVLGGVVPGVVKGAQWLAKPNADTATLASSALNQGIPLGISDVSGNRFVKGLRSVLDDLPFVGGIGERANNAKQSGFDMANAKVIGENKPLTPEVMSSAKSRIGGELNKVWENNNLKLDGKYVQDLQRIQQEAASKLNPEQAATVNKHIQNLLAKSDNAEISGGFANNWQSELRMAADGEKGLAQKILKDLRGSTLDAFNRGVAPADAAALKTAKTQYGAYKTLEPLMNKSEAGVAGRSPGQVPAALLPQRIVEQYGSTSRSPFGDLPQIGSQFIVNRTPQTGGSPRAAIQNMGIGSLLTGGAGAGLGGLAAGGAGAGVGAAMGLGGGALIEKLLSSPDVTRSVLTPAIKRGLLDNPELTPAVLELLKKSASRFPVAAGMGLLSAPAFE